MYLLQQYLRRAEHFLSEGESSSALKKKKRPQTNPFRDKEAISLRDSAWPLPCPGTFNGPVKDKITDLIIFKTAKLKIYRLQFIFNWP